LYGTAASTRTMRAMERRTAAEIEGLSRLPSVVAVGECGLDYFRDLSPRLTQRQVFAPNCKLPRGCENRCFLHQRNAQRILSPC